MNTVREKMKTNHEKFEELRDTLVSRMDAHRERMTACLGEMEVTTLEANSAELESVAESREGPKVHVWGLKKRHRVRHLAVRRRGDPKERTPEETGRCQQKDDPSCRSGTAQGTHRQEESDWRQSCKGNP
jgi:hypothetical protein